MHIITGLLVTALAGRLRRDKGIEGLPRFAAGPLQVAHALPGRIRLVAPSLRGAPEEQMPWLRELRTVEGVDAITFNPISGSMVIRYRPEALEPGMLFAAVARLMGVDKALNAPPQPLVTRQMKRLGAALNRAVYEESGGWVDLWTLAIAAMLVAGARKMGQGVGAAMPAGFTLLWWAILAINQSDAPEV